MPIVINGSGSITGISAGGLPDGIIQSADLASGVGGKIIQVVETKITARSSVNMSTTMTDVPGFSVTITPTSASNKIRLIAMINHSS